MGCSFCPEMIDAGVRSLDDCLGSFADRQLVEAIYIAKRKASSARLPSTNASVNGASGMPIFLNT